MSEETETSRQDAEGDPEGEACSPSLPEGMRVAPKDSKGRGSRNVQTVQLKQREGVRIRTDASSGGASEEGETEGQVEEQTDRVRSVRRSRREDPQLEEHWGSEGRSDRGAINRVALVGFSFLIPVLAIVMGFTLINRNRGTVEPSRRLDLSQPPSSKEAHEATSPITWFHENSAEAFDAGVMIMEEINQAGSPAQRSEWLRDAGNAVRRINRDGVGWDSGFFVADPRSLAWEYGAIEETGYIAISGRRYNQLPFRAYFVRTDEGLRMDWEASAGWSEVPVGRLIDEKPDQPVLVRAWLAKDASYDTLEPPGHLQSWYLLLSPDQSEFVWARVAAGEEVDRELKAALDYELFVLPREPEVRAVLRVVRPADARSESEFVVTELVARDWVLP